jgi:2-methylcitrate dehydratase PrpD
MKYYSEQIGDYITQLEYEDLPGPVVDQAKWVILDAIGVAIASWDTAWSLAVYNMVRKKAGSPESTIFYFGNKAPDMNAALVNAMFIQSMDLNDDLSGIHTGGILPPTAMAVGEPQLSTGREIITSIVIGYDVASRLAEAINSQALFEQGYQPSAILGGFAAAASACKLHKLTTPQIVNAFGISGSYTGGTIEFLKDGTDTKRFNIAKSTQAGIISTHLAREGLTGPGGIFEGDHGIFQLMSENTDPTKLVADLGTRFDILQTSFKKYPFCDGAFCPLDAALAIVRENDLEIEDIAALRFRIKSFLIPFLADYHGDTTRKYRPQNFTDAQFSLPYIIALGILKDGDIQAGDFSAENYNNPTILRLAQKVSACGDKELDKVPFRPMAMPSIATIELKDGRTFVHRVDYHRGDPRNPFVETEYLEKFQANVDGQLKKSAADRLVELITGLEKLSSISDIMKYAVR